MDDASLTSAAFWFPYIESIKFWAEAGVVVCLAAGVIADRIGAPMAKRIEHARELQIATLEKEGEAAKSEIVKANEAVTTARLETEHLRTQNLELQKAVSPRILEQSNSSKALKAFSGTPAFIIAVPDFEARRLAGQINVMLGMAQWKWAAASPTDLQLRDIQDGVNIEYIEKFLIDQSHLEEDRLRNERLHQNVDTLELQFKNSDIAVSRTGIPHTYAGKMWDQRFSQDAIVIKVGLKPTTYFSDKQLPDGPKIFGNH